VRNRSARHDFHPVSGYDPAQDGDDPRWGRIGVTCSVCHEHRRIFVSAAEADADGGCIRTGPDEPWWTGDLLLVPGGRLDEFEGFLPSGAVLTRNHGGSQGQWAPSDVTPWPPGETPRDTKQEER
jgi:hypothetical protein